MSDFRPNFARRDNKIGDELIELEGQIEVTTQKAYLVNWTNGEQCWIPKSCVVGELHETGDRQNFIFQVKEWWAKKNGFA